jgi:acyl-coenzyme A synthetase/AMP-(fatty) acid ligase
MLQNALAAAKDFGIPESRVWIFDVLGGPLPTGFKSWKELLNHGEKDWVRFNDEKSSKNTTAARLFSSGTTGLPKAASLSHYNFVAQHTLVHEADPRPWKVKRLLALPMFHAACVPGKYGRLNILHNVLTRSSGAYDRSESRSRFLRDEAVRPRVISVQRRQIFHHRVWHCPSDSNCHHHVWSHK